MSSTAVRPAPAADLIARLVDDLRAGKPAGVARAVSVVENHRPGFDRLLAAVHPELGTLEDFRHFVGAAKGHGMEVALDLAVQASRGAVRIQTGRVANYAFAMIIGLVVFVSLFLFGR